MSESKKSDIEISKALGEINDKLDNIEELLRKGRETSWYHFSFGLGMLSMAAGMGLASTGVQLESGVALFVVGCILSVAARIVFYLKCK